MTDKKVNINALVVVYTDMWQKDIGVNIQFNEPLNIQIGDTLVLEQVETIAGMAFKAILIRKESDGKEGEDVS